MKQWFFILFLSCMLPASSLAEYYAGPAVQKQERKYAKEDPQALLQTARKIYGKDTRKALDLIEEALLIGLRDENLRVQADSYKLLGEINAFLDQHDLAAANYERAKGLYDKLKSRGESLEMLRLSAKSYELAGQDDKALANYQAYLQKVEVPSKSRADGNSKEVSSTRYQFKDKKYKSLSPAEEVRLAISAIYARRAQFDLSVENLKQVAGTSSDTNEISEKQLIVNDKLGDVYREQDQDDEALNYYNSNAAAARKLNKPKAEGKANAKIAEILTSRQEEENALEFRDRSIEIYNLSNDTALLAREYLEKGRLLNSLNKLPESEVSLNSALDLAISLDDKEVERESYLEISSLDEKRGNIRKSLENYKKYVALQDEAYQKKEKALEERLALNTTLNDQQKRMELLEKNVAINNSTIEVLRANETIASKSATNQRLIIYGLLLIILFLAISGYLMYKNMQRKRMANQLLALKSLRAQMNPHFIFNALNSVNHYIAQKDELAANKYLSDFSRLMRAVLENSQEDFIPLSKELSIIRLYLQLEHNRFSEKFDYELVVDERLEADGTMIPPMLVQPYVENAIWHGLRYRESKGKLEVRYESNEQGLKITIEDNGIGRERSRKLKTQNQKRSRSTGMSNIEGRVSIINSMYDSDISVLVEDLEPETGTRISIEIPVTKQTLSAS